MAEKKMTKRDRYNMLLAIPAVANDDDLSAFITHELELLDKKSSTEAKPTEKQIANEGYMDAILEGMEDKTSYTVTALIKAIPAIGDLTNQRVSALLKKLIDAGRVTKTVEKRVSYFRKVGEGD